MRRAGFLTFHRWVGLALAPFLILQALTGAFLVLHELTLSRGIAAAAPVSAMVRTAQATTPGATIRRLYLPGSTGPAAFAELSSPAGPAYAEIDPSTGEAVRAGGLWRFPYRMVVQVHYRLADGVTGMVLVMLTGLFLALTAITGLVFWWPGRAHMLRALKVRRNTPARLRLRQWHRSTGAVTSLVAVFSAITGLMLIVPDLVPPAGAALSPAPPPASAAMIDRAVAAAQAQFPAARLRDIRFPAADRLDINFDAPERNARAVHAVTVTLSDGVVTKRIAAGDNPVLWMKVLALHTGEALPFAGPVLLLAEAAALVFLAWAGTRMWFQSRRKDRA